LSVFVVNTKVIKIATIAIRIGIIVKILFQY